MLTIHKIGQKATQALLFELATSPKPGLVDRRNSGAHCDMDYFTLSASAATLFPYFTKFALVGVANSANHPMEMLSDLRKLGILAEQAMFEITDNINTHKGAIFSIGIASAAVGYIMNRNEIITADNISRVVRQMTKGICEREYSKINKKKNLTKGEKIYLKYGFTGIRGEVEQGFPNVLKVSYPILKKCLKNNISFNDSMLEAYLHLLCTVNDTNVLGRHDLVMLEWLQKEAQCLINAGGMLNPENLTRLEYFDDQCIVKNVSPGGCADILALTAFMLFVEYQEWHYSVV